MQRAWIEINLKAIRENIEKIKKHTGIKFMACVKCDCYGMGMKKISSAVEDTVDYFAVATSSEAVSLRKAGIQKPVLVMGSVLEEEVEPLVSNNITITLCNSFVLNKISDIAGKTKARIKAHVKVDTGMGRIGIMPENIGDFLAKCSKIKNLQVEGIFTHLATASWSDKTYAKKQIEKFRKLFEDFPAAKNIPLKHIANSPSVINLPETYKTFDMVRIGLLMFGIYPAKHLRGKITLNCSLKGYAKVNHIKSIPPGTSLSYGITFTSKKEMKIATLSIGYGDGLRRFLSNSYNFLWHNKKINIVGNICMDQTLVDVTGTDITIGDKIEIFSSNSAIELMAEIGNTVPQEILCGFGSQRMEKIYIE
jgi:alanine racemase